jgi:hypothetical protein
MTAFEVPYAAHPVYALAAAPDETKMTLPCVLRSSGMASLSYSRGTRVISRLNRKEEECRLTRATALMTLMS